MKTTLFIWVMLAFSASAFGENLGKAIGDFNKGNIKKLKHYMRPDKNDCLERVLNQIKTGTWEVSCLTASQKGILLILATQIAEEPIVSSLIKNGADVNSRDKEKNTPLHWASSRRHIKTVLTLIENGADVNSLNKYNYSPLMHADNPEIALTFIENGANVNNESNYAKKNTPLSIASWYGRTKTVLVLIENGALVNWRDRQQNTPLHLASWNGHIKTALALIENGANVNSQNYYGNTPLFDASWNGHTETVLALIENGADVNSLNKYEKTPLHWASEQGHTKTVLALIEQGADVNNQNNLAKVTPLHEAIEKGHKETVLALIEQGADIEIENFRGENAFDMAKKADLPEITNILAENTKPYLIKKWRLYQVESLALKQE